MAWLWMPAFSLLGVGQSPRRASSCRPPLCRLPHLAAGTDLLQLPHQPGREETTGHSFTGNARTSNGCSSIRVPETHTWQGFSGTSMPAWCGVGASSIVSSRGMYCSEILASGFWQKLNGPPTPLPKPLLQHSQWQQYMADLCAPPSAGSPCPSTSPQEGAQQAARDLNVPISSADVESALPLLNNNNSGAGQGWPSELLRYPYQEVTGGDGNVSKLHVLERPLAAILDAAFQRGVFPDEMKSSLVIPVFKKGDKSDPANHQPIAVGEPLCRLYAAILNQRIVSWSEDSGLRAPCQAKFCPCMSTEHQLFALRHLIDRFKFQKEPLFTAFVDLKKAYDSVQHLLLWASLQRKGVHDKMLAAIQSSFAGGSMSMKVCKALEPVAQPRLGCGRAAP